MKERFNCYFRPDIANRLRALAAQQGVHRSQLVEAAIESSLSPDALDRREAAYVRRLDRVSRQLGMLERRIIIVIESHALFVHFWLSVTRPLGDGEQDGARAQGAKRYQGFIDELGRRLKGGGVFLREISEETWSGAPPANANGGAADEQED